MDNLNLPSGEWYRASDYYNNESVYTNDLSKPENFGRIYLCKTKELALIASCIPKMLSVLEEIFYETTGTNEITDKTRTDVFNILVKVGVLKKAE